MSTTEESSPSDTNNNDATNGTTNTTSSSDEAVVPAVTAASSSSKKTTNTWADAVDDDDDPPPKPAPPAVIVDAAPPAPAAPPAAAAPAAAAVDPPATPTKKKEDGSEKKEGNKEVVEAEIEEGGVRPRPAETPDQLAKKMQRLALLHQEEMAKANDRLKVIQADASSHLSSVKTFQELDLPDYLLKAVFAMGFNKPSAIQEEALPRILADPPHNLIGQAQSGSGKTAAFCLGMLYRLNVNTPATTQALCVTPTREIAVQIFQQCVTPMSQNMTGLKVQLALAGEMIERGKTVDAHMVIGTPGKVVDWLKRRTINPKTIKVFVLDEADQMVDESGHRANSLLIKKQLPKNCQCLLFSATFPQKVVEFATKMVHNPDKILIETGPDSLVLDVIKQLWVDCRDYPGGKREFLADIYSLLTIGQSIVFVATKREADEVHRVLDNGGYSCSVLHGQVENKDRDSTMEAFRKGESNVLITTNVLARGVDVENVCLVVNYDVPVDKNKEPDYETYLHRIGRTGRFGRKGTAINLISDQQSLEVLAQIEAHFSTEGKEMIQNTEADPESLADSIEI